MPIFLGKNGYFRGDFGFFRNAEVEGSTPFRSTKNSPPIALEIAVGGLFFPVIGGLYWPA